jgi:hypothetical protein
VALDDLPNLTILSLFNNDIWGNIDDLDLSANTDLTGLHLYDNQIGGSIDGLDLTANTRLAWLNLSDNQIGGSIDGFDLSRNTRLARLQLSNNQIGGSIDGFDLSRNTDLVWLDLDQNAIRGNINGFDLSRHRDLDRLELQHNQMYGPLPSWMNGGSVDPSLNISFNQCLQPSGIPRVDNHVTSQDPDWQTSNAGCSLRATAACSGADLEVTVTSGDPSFNIAADDPGGNPQTDTLAAVGSTILTSGAGVGTWTNIFIVENSGDTETVNLPVLTCGQAAPADDRGGCPACMATGPAPLTIDVIPPTAPAAAMQQGDGAGIFVLDDTPTWLIEVTNPNSAAVNDVVARAQIDKTVEITNITSTHGSTSADAENVVTMLLGTLEGGETATINVETKIVPVGEVCTSGWLGLQQVDDTECVDMYMLPGTLPATGGRPVRVADLWGELLAGGVMISVALGWVWIRRRGKG